MTQNKNQQLLHSSARIIYRDFNLDEENAGRPEFLKEMQQLYEVVAREVAYLIDHDLERLKWILYRVDVDERKLQDSLAGSPASEASEKIAKLIIDRQMEKAETRLRYKEGRL